MRRDHPTDPDLLAYVTGHLRGPSCDDVESHLEHCTNCANRIAALSVDEDSFVVLVKEAFARRDSAEGIPIAENVVGPEGPAHSY